MSYIWNNPVFIDFCCREPFNLNPTTTGTSCTDVTGYPWSICFISRVLQYLYSEPENVLPLFLRNILIRADGHLGAKSYAGDTGAWSRLLALSRCHASQTNSELTSLVCETVGRLKGLQPGGVCIVPTGISLSPDQPPIFFLIIIHRPLVSTSCFFKVGIINSSGFGSEFHEFKIGERTKTGVIERDVLFVLNNVLPDHIMHSSFWVATYRLLLRPAPTNIHTFYTILLPHLNNKPLFSNWNQQLLYKKDTDLNGHSTNVELCCKTVSWFIPPPQRHPGSCVPGALACLYFILQFVEEVDYNTTRLIKLFLSWSICLICREDIEKIKSKRETFSFFNLFYVSIIRYAIQTCCLNISDEAGAQADELNDVKEILTENQFIMLKQSIDQLEKMISDIKLQSCDNELRQSYSPCPEHIFSPTFKILFSRVAFPLFGRFRKDVQPDFLALAGDTAPPALLIPVDLVSVTNRVIGTAQDVCNALRQCQDVCTLLANQHQLISHTYVLRFQLIRHLILEVIPLPLSCKSIDKNTTCFWLNQLISRETLTEILRLLHSLTRHFVTACFSVYNTRDIDAQRVIVMAGICCLADVVLRLPLIDGISAIGSHYNGTADGPTNPFVFDITFFADQSEFFLLMDPVLNTARTQILDYLTQLHETVSSDHIIFSFESKMELGIGDLSLLQQICLQYGFNSRHESLPLYFTGDDPDFIDFIPEWYYFRDIVFYFKALMVPDASTLPSLKRWMVSDATLRWTYNVTKNQVSVRGFHMILECAGFVKNDYYEKRFNKDIGGSVMTKFLGWFGMAAQRVPPSAADPTNLMESHERIETEDDVLHIKKLPSFNGKLTGQDTEILLQYLTVPYIRIPLILQFFADEMRIDSLTCVELQQVLLATVFEPSLWQHEYKKESTEVIPPRNRQTLSTPLGLLFNELTYAPTVLLDSLENMLDIALDKDTGRHCGDSAKLLLFIVRLTIGIDRFVLFLINHYNYWNQKNNTNASITTILSGCGYRSNARGLHLPQLKVYNQLRTVHERIQKRIHAEVLPLLDNWAVQTVKHSDLVAACSIHAHIIAIFSDYNPLDYTFQVVSRLLSSLFFVITHHQFTLEANCRVQNITEQCDHSTSSPYKSQLITTLPPLGIPDMDVFLVLQKHRHSLLNWLQQYPSETDKIMELTVLLVSFANNHLCNTTLSNISPPSTISTSRHWQEMNSFGGKGRFVPESEARSTLTMHDEVTKALILEKKTNDSFKHLKQLLLKTFSNVFSVNGTSVSGSVSNPTALGTPTLTVYEAWLRAITRRTADTEINLQLAEFSLRRNPMELLEDWVNDFPEFVNLFGPVSPLSTFQCSIVSATNNRYWCRLVGRRHDLQRWEHDSKYKLFVEFTRPYSPIHLLPSEAWIGPILDVWLPKHLPGAQLFLEDSSAFSPSLESAVKSSIPSSPTSNTQVSSTYSQDIDKHHINNHANNHTSNLKTLVRLSCLWPPLGRQQSDEFGTQTVSSIKEIVISLFPTTIEVFDIVEVARQFYAKLCYSSDLHYSFSSFPSSYTPSIETSIPSFILRPHSQLSKDIISAPCSLSYSSKHVSYYSISTTTKPSSIPQSLCGPTLSITRDMYREFGIQQYIAVEYLYGLLPTCLLNEYEFWQNDSDGCIIGYQKAETITSSVHSNLLKITIMPIGPVRRIKGGYIKTGDGIAIVRRIMLKKQTNIQSETTQSSNLMLTNDSEMSDMTFGKVSREKEASTISQNIHALRSMEGAHTLINLKYLDPLSELVGLRDCLCGIEDLSHILVWSYTHLSETQFSPSFVYPSSDNHQTDIPDKPTIPSSELTVDLIEMPRLGLSFRATNKITKRPINRHSSPTEKNEKAIQQDVKSTSSRHVNRIAFCCDQHAGLYLSSKKFSSESLTTKLIQGIPNCLLLENDDGELFLLVDAVAKPLLVHSPLSSDNASNVSQNTVYNVLPAGIVEQQTIEKISPSVIFDRNNDTWLQNLGESRHYIYSIHSSRSFLFSPTSASALYLLLLRFLKGEYEDVCKSADSAHMFDSGGDAEEEQIWRILNTLDYTKLSHPDAHATRIKLWLGASRQTFLSNRVRAPVINDIKKLSASHRSRPWGLKIPGSHKKKEPGVSLLPIAKESTPLSICAWSIEQDLLMYVQKFSFVSGVCRLTPLEELEAMRLFPSLVQSVPSLYNRQVTLQTLLDSKKICQIPSIQPGALHLPSVPHIDQFDHIIDRSAIDTFASPTDMISNIIGSIAIFKRPEESMTGSEATSFFLKSLDRNFKLFSDWHFFYELLTDGCQITVIPGERTYVWGVLLTRFLGVWDFQTKSQLMSFLRILISNPQITHELPHLKDDKKSKLPLGLMLRSQETFQRFFKELQACLKEKNERYELIWPNASLFQSGMRRPISPAISLKSLTDVTSRLTVASRIGDTSCRERKVRTVNSTPYLSLLGINKEDKQKFGISDITPEAIQSFSTKPLSQHVKLSAVIIHISPEVAAATAAAATAAVSTTASLNNEGSYTTINTAGLVNPNVPFILGHHAAAKTPIGQATLHRLEKEMRAYSEQANTEKIPQLAFLNHSEISTILSSYEQLTTTIHLLEQLRNLLSSSYIKDGRFVDFGIRLVVKIANYYINSDSNTTKNPQNTVQLLHQWAFIFGKLSRSEPTVTFDILVSILLCSEAELELHRFNPFINDQVHCDILSLTSSILFVVNRRSQICRCLHGTIALIQDLSHCLEYTSGDKQTFPTKQDIIRIQLLIRSLTESLETARHYVHIEHDGNNPIALFDPRLLVFEFAYNIILRKSQVELIQTFTNHVTQKLSLCHQAVMGSGKTTIVAPLLALLLADRADLVVQVVPHALLEFTRTIMHERFSAVVKKGVMTFSFSRYQSITPQLFSALIQAKEKKAVVLATPTSIKSVFLKVIQLLHLLDISAAQMSSTDYIIQTGQRQFRKLRDTLGKVFKIPILTDTIDTTHLSGKLTDEEFRVVRRELDLTLRTLNLFKTSVLLLDEVDLILHPLKSELHWPIGPKQPLDFTRPCSFNQDQTIHRCREVSVYTDDSQVEVGLRWKLPWHLLDAIFYVQSSQRPRRLSVPFGYSREAWRILEDFREEIGKGLKDKAIQRTPHLLLLNEHYYHSKLKIHLARWLHFGLRSLRFHGLSASQTIQLLCSPLYCSWDHDVLVTQLLSAAENNLQDLHIRMLNHSREWLNSFLPHVLQKVNRVGFGIMTATEISQQLLTNPTMPATRHLLAVPFVGKDSPSLTSEFAHPDIIIGLTILAYRYDGMRQSDFLNALTEQIRRLSDGFGPVYERSAAIEFSSWVTAAGGKVRGRLRRQRVNGNDVSHTTQLEGTEYFVFGGADDCVNEVKEDNNTDPRISCSMIQSDTSSLCEVSNNISSKSNIWFDTEKQQNWRDAFERPLDKQLNSNVTISNEIDEVLFQRIWPLELINLHGDPQQFDLLYKLLWREPLVIKSLLFHTIFPLALQQSTSQLSASGQELGGSCLFPVRLGFSGTPSDLLPIELGSTVFQPGTDGKIIHLLTNPDVMSVEILNDCWNVDRLLDLVASRTDANAFIDSGALITGKSNFAVARSLLDRGLSHVDGVVFLDEADRQMILVRNGWRVMKLAQCGISCDKRFTFYDQVHTTGQDIRQAATAKALITVGKDMTFRDLAQGAWRMRGIGMGQTLSLILPPEVADLVEKNARQSRNLTIDSSLFKNLDQSSSFNENGNDKTHLHLSVNISLPNVKKCLSEICAWLVIRGIQSESLQLRLLSQQNLFNIWRKNAFNHLCAAHSEIGSAPLQGHLLQCLQLFQDTLDFCIPTHIPKPQTFYQKLSALAVSHSMFVESEEDRQNIERTLEILRAHDAATKDTDELGDMASFQVDALEAEIVQEQEQEQEEEEEEEQEQEQEQEQEKEQEQEVDVSFNQKFSRANENTKFWDLKMLSISPLTETNKSHPVFYPLSQFGVLKKIGTRPNLLHFPECLWVSPNYFDKQWSLNTIRRLKNVLVIVEWIPDIEEKRQSSSVLNVEQRFGPEQARIAKAFALFDRTNKNRISINCLQELLGVLDIVTENYDDWKNLESLILKDIRMQRMSQTQLDPSLKIDELNGFNDSSFKYSYSKGDRYSPPKNIPYLSNSQNQPLSPLHSSSLFLTPGKSAGRTLLPISIPNLSESYNKPNQSQLGTVHPVINNTDLKTLDSSLFLSSDLLGIHTPPVETHPDPSHTNSTIVPPDNPMNITSVNLTELQGALRRLNLVGGVYSDPPRHFVMVSLEEAEGLRAVMHTAIHRGASTVVPSTNVALALRHVGSRFSLLDISQFFLEEQQRRVLLHGAQKSIAHACFRFINSEQTYSQQQIGYLLRALQQNECKKREEYFHDIRLCRRRLPRQISDSQALFQIFSTPDDVALVQLRAVGTRMRQELSARGMSLSDGFNYFDTERNGRLTSAQIYAGLRWLQIKLPIEDFVSIWRHVSKDREEFCTDADFTRAFGPSSIMYTDSLDAGNSSSVWLSDNLPFGQERFTSVQDILTTDEIQLLLGGTIPRSVSGSLDIADAKTYEKLKFRLQTHTAFKKVWEGYLKGTDPVRNPNMSLKNMSLSDDGILFSVWCPEQLESRYRGLTRRNRERISFGYVICVGNDMFKYFNSRKDLTVPMIYEVEDPKTSSMSESPELRKLLDKLCPFPIRYKLIWRDSRSAMSSNPSYQTLTLWKPIPAQPQIFTSIGLCVTETGLPPSLTSVRCIPIKWTESSPTTCSPLWKLPIRSGKDSHLTSLTLSISTNMRLLGLLTEPLDVKAAAFTLQYDQNSNKSYPEPIGFGKPKRIYDIGKRDSGDFLTGEDMKPIIPCNTPIDQHIPRLIPKKISANKSWF